VRSPGFEVNDLSYMQRADYIWNDANLARQWTVPGSWYRSIFTVAGGQIQHNYDGDRTMLQGHGFFNVQFHNYWNVFGYHIYRPTVMDDELTRGGPVVKRNGEQDAAVGLNTDARRSVVLSAFVEGNAGLSEPSQELTPHVTALFKPTSSVSITFGPSLDLNRSSQQYDTSVVAPGYTLFYGTRYIFANIDQVTLSLDTRISVAFTPTLALDVYAQPFFASGHYYAFKQFDHPRQLHQSVYGIDVGSISEGDGEYCIDPTGPAASARPVCDGPDATPGAFAILNPDFNTRSLRGNAVLRWEYRPGSTIYFVWEQTRYDDNLYGPVGNFALGRDEGYLSRAPPDDVFLIKLDWWVGR
jgi:hypothetical protein